MLGGLVGVAITVLAFRLALRLARDRVRAAFVTVAALAGLYTLWSERPLLLGVLLLVALLWVVEVPDSWVGRHPLVALPVDLLALGERPRDVRARLRVPRPAPPRPVARGAPPLGRAGSARWSSAAALGFVACFLNPYGAALVTFPVDLLRRGDALKGVIEWSSPDFHSVRGLSFALWVVVFAVVLAKAPRGRVTVRDLVVTIPFLLLAPVGAPQRPDRTARRPPGRRTRRRRRTPRGLAAADRMGGERARRRRDASSWAYAPPAQPDFALDAYPVRAMAAVERNGLLGKRLLVDDADAGYVILRYWPRAARLHGRPLRHVPDVGDPRLHDGERGNARMGPGAPATAVSTSSSGAVTVCSASSCSRATTGGSCTATPTTSCSSADDIRSGHRHRRTPDRRWSFVR